MVEIGFILSASTGSKHLYEITGVNARISCEEVKRNVVKHNSFGFVRFPDGHVEVRWPESPDQWSYYVAMDAALVAAELRGYTYEP